MSTNDSTQIDPYQLFEQDIYDHYTKTKSVAPTEAFDYDGQEKNTELVLLRVPQDFDTSLLQGKEIFLENDELDKNWELTACPYENPILEVLLPVQALDGAVALAPEPIKKIFNITKKVQVENSITKATELRNAPFVQRKQPEGLKMHFFPYGFHTGDKSVLKKEQKSNVSTTKKNKSIEKLDEEPIKKKKKKDKNLSESNIQAEVKAEKKQKKKKSKVDQTF